MKVFDCFMYYNEDTILDVRLNYLNKFVDYFIIVESTFNHRGQKKELNFDIKKFSQFKNKIRYYILDDQPKDIEEVDINDSEDEKNSKYILNGYRRDHFQRNHIIEGIKDAQENDIIIISDIDEIPKLENINFEKLKNKLIFFKQKMCYYKFNLFHKNYDWFGSRACIKKMLLSPQWLRDIKTKSYPFWRLDLLFSKKKYSNIKMDNDLNPIGIENLKKRIENRESVYNLNLDQKKNQFSEGVSLDFLEMNELPEYIAENKIKYKNWLD